LRVFSSSNHGAGTAAASAASKKIFFPQSPCPSPTPVFQQLYMAISQFDRLVRQESPDIFTLMEKSPKMRSNSMSNVIVGGNNHNIADNERELMNSRRQSYPISLSSASISLKEARGSSFSRELSCADRCFTKNSLKMQKKPFKNYQVIAINILIPSWLKL
jgi:hypothetical protein